MGLKQYQVVLVNLDPTTGSEIKKTRPCLIISPDEMNRYLKTLVIAPMTTVNKPYPTRVQTKLKGKKGWIVLDQIRTIDRTRVIKVLGSIPPKEIAACKSVVREAFVD